MRFRVWEKGIKAEKGDVLLRLRSGRTSCFCDKCDHDSVAVLVVDEDGDKVNCGSLLSFEPDKISLPQDVSKDIGLPLDEKGSLKFDVPIEKKSEKEKAEEPEKEEDMPEELKELLSVLIAPLLIEKILKKHH